MLRLSSLALLGSTASCTEEETSLLQMPVVQDSLQADSDASECRCPGYFQEQCEAEAAQGCVWTDAGSSNQPWCQCLNPPTDAIINPTVSPITPVPDGQTIPVPITAAPITAAPEPEEPEEPEEPVAPEEPLWSQHMEDRAKCNNNVDVQYVNNQAECQQIAVAAGHPYYSFRHNEESSGHKCMSSATCVDILTDRNNEWNMYIEPGHQPPQAEPLDVDETGPTSPTMVDQATGAVPRPAGDTVLLSGIAQCPDCTCEVSAPDPHWNPASGCQSMFDDVLQWGGGPGLHLQNDASLTVTFPLPELIDHVALQQIQNHGNNYWRGDFAIETFNNGVWTVRARVDDLSVQDLPLEGDGRFTFQFAQPVIATKVRMSAGNPQNGNGEIFRLEELQVYGWDETDSLSPSDELEDQTTGVVPRPAGAVTLLSGNTQCPDCTCEVSATDPHWSNSGCQSMFDDVLRWGGGPGLHLRNDASLTVTFPGPELIDRVDLQQIQNHGSGYWRGDFAIETFNDGVWTVRARVGDLSVQELPMGVDGRNTFQFAQPVIATQVRMSGGNPQNGNGEIYRLEELQVYGWPDVVETGPTSPTMVDQSTGAVPRPAGDTVLLSGTAQCPDCACEVSAPDPHWGNSGCQSMFDDVLRWGGGPGLHLQNDASLTVTFPLPELIDHVALQQIQNHGNNYWRGDFAIETFNDGVWTVRARVDDLSVQDLPLEGDGRFMFQFAQPVIATQVRMNAGNPQNGNGEIFRLEELQVYGWEDAGSLSPSTGLVDQATGAVPRPVGDAALLSGTAQCPDCTCEVSAPDPHWGNSGCQSMFDDVLQWGGGPGLHLQNDASLTVTFPGPELIDRIDLQQIQNHGSAYWRGDFAIETFNDGVWTVRARVDDLSVQELPMGDNGRNTFQLAQPVTATQVRMSGGNPQNGNGEIFRLEELQVYGFPVQ